MVRLESERTGRFLQVVPTLTDVDLGINEPYHNGGLRLRGTGFVGSGVTINFDGASLPDRTTGSSPINTGAFFVFDNDGMDLTVPSDVPFGPISVSTLGGTSDPFGLTFTGVVSVAESGTPADAGEASANPGQAITLQGSGFDSTTDVLFRVVDANGTELERIVRPTAVNDDGTELTVIVPVDAKTSQVGIVGDQNDTRALLQVIPVVTNLDITSLNAFGTNANFQLHGAGFVEGHDSVYTFGGVTLTDTSNSSTPINVFASSQVNDRVNVTVDVPVPDAFRRGDGDDRWRYQSLRSR